MDIQRVPYRASRWEMTAMVVVPVLAGFLIMYLRITPTTVVARLMLLWALYRALRGASTTVREWTDDIHLVVGGFAWASMGLRDRPDSVAGMLTYVLTIGSRSIAMASMGSGASMGKCRSS